MTSSINRRTLVKGAAWAAPAVAATSLIPAYATSCKFLGYGGPGVPPIEVGCGDDSANGGSTGGGSVSGGSAGGGSVSGSTGGGGVGGSTGGNTGCSGTSIICTSAPGVTGGLFVSVRGEQIGTYKDPIYIDMISGGSGNGVIDRHWDDATQTITDGGHVRNTNGIVTPYGTLGSADGAWPGQVPSFQTYGGSGLWFSSPVTSTGQKSGDYFTDFRPISNAYTTLEAGATFTMSIKLEYTSQAAQQRLVPYMGVQGSSGTWSAGKSFVLAVNNTSQGSRAAINGARINCVFGNWNQTNENGKWISYGDVTMTTLDSLTARTTSGAVQFQQLSLVPPLKINGMYQTTANPLDILAVSATLSSNGNARFSSNANGRPVQYIQDLKTVEAHLTGPAPA